MENFLDLKGEIFDKFSNNEEGRKIINQMQRISKAYMKLSSRDRKIFFEEFEGKFRSAIQKLQLIHDKNEHEGSENLMSQRIILIFGIIL